MPAVFSSLLHLHFRGLGGGGTPTQFQYDLTNHASGQPNGSTYSIPTSLYSSVQQLVTRTTAAVVEQFKSPATAPLDSTLLQTAASTATAAAATAASSSASSSTHANRSILYPLARLVKRVTIDLFTFIFSHIRHWPIISHLIAQIQAFYDRYDYNAFASTDQHPLPARLMDQFIKITRMVGRVFLEVIRFFNWILDPLLFFRRLYRFCVGIIVFYCMHAFVVYVSDRLRNLTEWLRLERGIWKGDAKCIRKRQLDLSLASAQTYEEWKAAALELDELEYERTIWKRTTPSSEYQFKRIAKNVESIRNLIATHKLQQQQQKDGLDPNPPVASISSSSPHSSPSSSTTAAAPSTLSSHASTSVAGPSSNAIAASVAATTATGTATVAPSVPSIFASNRSASDPQALMRFLRSRLNRNIGNITNSRLYYDAGSDHFSSIFPDPSDTASQQLSKVSLPPCRIGTKHLIESYHSYVIEGLETILHDPNIPPSTKLSFFRETRHAYGRSALLLNGGSNLGLLHLGVVKALLEMDSLPQIICGSSTGAIFAALICSRTDAELSQIGSDHFLELEFPSVQGSLRRKLRRFLEEGILMDIGALIECVRGHIGDLTFEQAYQRYGRILNIVVTPIHMAGKRRPSDGVDDETDHEESQHSSEPILLNYLTAPSVLIWSAACASCAVPHLYAPVELLAKNPVGEIIPYFGNDNDEHMRFGAGCVDGGVAKMDVAMDRLRTLFNTNNFIVSQLNLSLLPFIFGGASFSSAGPLQKLLRYLGREFYQRVTNLCCLFGLTTENLATSSLGRHSLVRIALYLHSLTSQAIFGNITLVPPVSLRDYSQLLENPSTKRLNHCVDVARRYTWTRGSLIKAHCVVEFALDRCVRKVRSEMGLAPLPSVSAAFAHPNRNYASVTVSSPSVTPVPANLFWTKKLNARAIQPSRKPSFTGESPIPPTLDLGIGRTSPIGAQRSTHLQLSNGVTTPNGNGYIGNGSMHSSPTSSMHPPPYRSSIINTGPNSSPVASHPLRHLTINGTAQPPSSTFISTSTGVNYPLGNPIRSSGPSSLTVTTSSNSTDSSTTGMPNISSTASPTSTRDSLDRSRITRSDQSSLPSTAPSSPIPADSSHDDLVNVVGGDEDDASSVSLSPASSQISRAPSKQPSRIVLKDSSRTRFSPSPSASATSVTPTQTPITNTTTDGSLLRSVPSLPGRSPIDFSLTNTGASNNMLGHSQLPSSTSQVKVVVDDGFNNGVISHLHEQMMFAMPLAKKKKKAIGRSNHTQVMPLTHTLATPSGDTNVCPSTSGSDTCPSDAELSASTTPVHQQNNAANEIDSTVITKA